MQTGRGKAFQHTVQSVAVLRAVRSANIGHRSCHPNAAIFHPFRNAFGQPVLINNRHKRREDKLIFVQICSRIYNIWAQTAVNHRLIKILFQIPLITEAFNHRLDGKKLVVHCGKVQGNLGFYPCTGYKIGSLFEILRRLCHLGCIILRSAAAFQNRAVH